MPLLGSKLNDAKLENEELELTVIQSKESFKAMDKRVPELKNQVESLETEQTFLLQKNKELWSDHVRQEII